MGKAKRAAKRARKQARGTGDEAALAAQEAHAARTRGRKRLVILAMPVVVLVAAVLLHAVADRPQLAGIVGLAGAVVWFPLWLGTLGSEVPRRDRRRGGSIDFGKRG